MRRPLLRLLEDAQAGDTAAAGEICRHWDHIAKQATRSFFILGGEPDDLLQEARLGLLSGIRTFRREFDTEPEAFLYFCARRAVTTAVKTASTIRKDLLTRSVRVWVGEDGECDPFEYLPSHWARDPYYDAVVREELREILALWSSLTELERESMLMSINGIMMMPGWNEDRTPETKRLDNAIQRVQKKIRDKTSLREAA